MNTFIMNQTLGFRRARQSSRDGKVTLQDTTLQSLFPHGLWRQGIRIHGDVPQWRDSHAAEGASIQLQLAAYVLPGSAHRLPAGTQRRPRIT